MPRIVPLTVVFGKVFPWAVTRNEINGRFGLPQIPFLGRLPSLPLQTTEARRALSLSGLFWFPPYSPSLAYRPHGKPLLPLIGPPTGVTGSLVLDVRFA